MQEHPYRTMVALSKVIAKDGYQDTKIWREHQRMQFDYVKRQGLATNSVFMDIGCGPMRLGQVVIPELSSGWFYGVDINADTIALGQQVLEESNVSTERCTFIVTDEFDLSGCDHKVDLAFSNSLMSHLNLNSIMACLMAVRRVIADDGVYCSTFFLLPEGQQWDAPFDRMKWDKALKTYPLQNSYHYTMEMMEHAARLAGFSIEIDESFGHPSQTMGVFRPI